MNTIAPTLCEGQAIISRISERTGTIIQCLLKNDGGQADVWRYEYRVQWDDADPGELQTMFYPTILPRILAQPHGGGEDAATAGHP